MKIEVRIPRGTTHTIEASCITEALRIFYRRGLYTSGILLEAKWIGWLGWISYNVKAEISVERA